MGIPSSSMCLYVITEELPRHMPPARDWDGRGMCHAEDRWDPAGGVVQTDKAHGSHHPRCLSSGESAQLPLHVFCSLCRGAGDPGVTRFGLVGTAVLRASPAEFRAMKARRAVVL